MVNYLIDDIKLFMMYSGIFLWAFALELALQ